MTINELKEIGCYMICFTANADKDFVLNYLTENKIPFDAINENPPFFKCEERKIYFNALLDDRAGLQQVYNELNLLILPKALKITLILRANIKITKTHTIEN